MNLRILGFITLLTAPAMTIAAARHNFQPLEDTVRDDLTGALLFGAFAIGWWCAMFALYQLKVIGSSRWSRWFAALPLVTIGLAFTATPADIWGLDMQHPLYIASDLAWPLSMFLTFLIGIAAVVVRVLPDAYRWVPLFAGSSVPIALVFSILGVNGIPEWVFDLHIVVGWMLLGCLAFDLGGRKRNESPTERANTPSPRTA